MLITSCIWCSPLQHSLSRPPLVVFLLLHYRKKAQCDTKRTMEKTTRPWDCQTQLLGYLMPTYDLETMQEEEYKILTPLFLITNPWVLALIGIIPQIPHGRRHSSSGRSLLCVIPSASWGLKPPFYFLHALSPYSFFFFFFFLIFPLKYLNQLYTTHGGEIIDNSSLCRNICVHFPTN